MYMYTSTVFNKPIWVNDCDSAVKMSSLSV